MDKTVVKRNLAKALRKLVVAKLYNVNLINKDTKKNKTLQLQLNGDDITIANNLNELSKKDIITGIVCVIMASGMVSCKKDTDGFGYNMNTKSTKYYKHKGTPNKDVTIVSPTNVKTYKVDSTYAEKGDFYSSNGSKFGRPITPTEAEIFKVGFTHEREVNQNNGAGTSGNEIWDYDPNDAYISGGYYEDEEVNFKTVREHPSFKKGIEILNSQGVNTNAMLSKADKEVAQQNWIKTK